MEERHRVAARSLPLTPSVLIVDDDDDFREALAAAITTQGFRVVHACNGCEALRLLADPAGLPCAMLIDLMMPVMTGWELLDALDRDRRTRRIPSAVLSAARDTGDLPGWVILLRKPFALPDLLSF